MDIETLVQLHKALGDLDDMLLPSRSPLPETIDPDKLKAIAETREVIEKLIAYMKKQAIPFFSPVL